VTVRTVNVGTTGVVLILRVLVEAELLKLVIVLEPEWLTIPPVPLVIPAITPDPLILIVPVFVKLDTIVVQVAEPLIANIPPLVIVEIEQVPAAIFTVPEVFDIVPVPVKEVEEFIVPVLVSVPPVILSKVAHVSVPLFDRIPGEVIVSDEIEIGLAPPSMAPDVEIVALPDNETVPPAFVIPAPKTRVVLAPVIVPPFSVTTPVKDLLPALTGTLSVPLMTVVAPLTPKFNAPDKVRFPPFKTRFRVTPKEKAPVVNVPPLRIKSRPTIRFAPCDTVAVPFKVKSLVTEFTVHVLVPLPLKIRLLYVTTFTF